MPKSSGFLLLKKSKVPVFIVSILVFVTGCGGTKLLSEPHPIDISRALVTAKNESISVSLMGVIVRDGPGTWARKADWDEYLLIINNLSNADIEINEISLTDLLSIVFETSSDRKELVGMSRDSVDRYDDSDLKITSGIGAGALLTAGGAIAVVGTAAAVSVAPAAALGGGATIGMAPAIVAGAVLLSPVFAVAGLKRLSNVSKVSRVIAERSTDFPLTINSGEEALVDVFFPLSPSPLQLEINYTKSGSSSNLVLPTQDVLSGLHMLQ